MADIELVIKIPQKVYKAICDKNALGCDIGDIKNIIRNGTPLPKGHGNLIDIKDLYEHLNKERDDNFVLKADAIVSKIKPIIEADKAESEG